MGGAAHWQYVVATVGFAFFDVRSRGLLPVRRVNAPLSRFITVRQARLNFCTM